MGENLVTALLPVLADPPKRDFDLFQVLHHGTHEKQISNLFAWLLDAGETHQLGDAFQAIFVDEINRCLPTDQQVQPGQFSVRQEVNTAPEGEGADMADLVLESESTVIVVENYRISDGHGHSYHHYRDFGLQRGKASVVVMLCRIAIPDALMDGWENAPILSYGQLIGRITQRVRTDQVYQNTYPQQSAFFDQMRQHFVEDRNVNDVDLSEFVRVACATGYAGHYRQNPEVSAVNFADTLRDRALHQFQESRELLGRVKAELGTYCAGELKDLVNDSLGRAHLLDATANFRGIYQWTINLHTSDEAPGAPSQVQIKFGPSAWYALSEDADWDGGNQVETADYGYLFLTARDTRLVEQSAVTILEILSGIPSNDTRLRDEVIARLNCRG